MYLDFSKIKLDADGTLEQPLLKLKSMDGRTFGILNGVYDLSLKIGWAELSEISFSVPYMVDGLINPLYDQLTGFKIIHTEKYGIYIIASPSTEGDGLQEVKHIKGYSLEKKYERKNFFLAEGAYKLWDADVNNKNTIAFFLKEIDPKLKVVCESSTLTSRYAWFDQYKNNALTFLYNDLLDKYRALAVFDPYLDADGYRTLHLYDADADIDSLPIYLSYANLLEQTEVTEISDELITKLSVYGADDLSIRDVNPLGQDYLICLDYFIENGDIGPELAAKIEAWQAKVESKKHLYSGLVATRAALTAKKLSMDADLVDLQGKLETLTTEQNAIIQGISLCKEGELENGGGYQGETKVQWEEKLAAKTGEVAKCNSDIKKLKTDINGAETEIDRYKTDIADLAKSLAITNTDNFSEEEQLALNEYLIEDEITEATFVATSIDTNASKHYKYTLSQFTVESSELTEVESETDKEIVIVSGGRLKFTIDGETLAGDISSGTLILEEGDGLATFSLSNITIGDNTHPTALVSVTGVMHQTSFDEDSSVYSGSSTNPTNNNSLSMLITVGVTDYHKYSVQRELMEYGEEILREKAFPTYEFSLDSANFLFDPEYIEFKNNFEFGKAIYLMLGSHGRQEAPLIGLDFDFSDAAKMSMTFSNRFQRHDGRAKLKDMIGASYSSSRSFDSSKYMYKQAANKTSQVSDFMNSALNASVNNVINKTDQTVLINGAGIQVGGNNDYQLRIVDDMIAMTDNAWQSSKLALGRFVDASGNTVYGINTELLAGKLIIGESLLMENVKTVKDENGSESYVTQFKFDETGAWLNNATMVFQKDGGGKILIDPEYGIVAGTADVFTVDGSTVVPSFLNSEGKMVLDDDGIPTNANFYLSSQDGKAYFRGEVVAGSGDIGGWKIGIGDSEGRLYSGSGKSYVALNSSSVNDGNYAIWAGAEDPGSSNCSFYVKRDGTVKVKGDLDASSFSINGETALDDADQITGDFLNLKGVLVGQANDPNFYVDANGNVTIKGKITMGAGSSINWSNVTESNNAYSDAYSLAQSANATAATAKNTADNASNTVAGLFTNIDGNTYIDGSLIYVPTLAAEQIDVGDLRLYGDLAVYESVAKDADIGGYLGYATTKYYYTGKSVEAIHMVKRKGSGQYGGEASVSEIGSKMTCYGLSGDTELYVGDGRVRITNSAGSYWEITGSGISFTNTKGSTKWVAFE